MSDKVNLEEIRERKQSAKEGQWTIDPEHTALIGDIEKLLELVDWLSTWTPGLPPSPGIYAVRTIGAKMLPSCMEIEKVEGDWGTLEWVRLPE